MEGKIMREVVMTLGPRLAFALTDLTGVTHSTRPSVVPVQWVTESMEACGYDVAVELRGSTNSEDFSQEWLEDVRTPGPGYDLVDRGMQSLEIFYLEIDGKL
jgi:hypothetical protein